MKRKFNEGQMLGHMFAIVAKAHDGQTDKAGKPYILHLIEVMKSIDPNDEELQCAALGHDLFEDTKVNATFLRKEGFPERVIKTIDKVTRKKGQSDEEYEDIVLSSIDSMLVKKGDLEHNSSITRLKGLRPKDIARTIHYHAFYTRIKEDLNYARAQNKIECSIRRWQENKQRRYCRAHSTDFL